MQSLGLVLIPELAARGGRVQAPGDSNGHLDPTTFQNLPELVDGRAAGPLEVAVLDRVPRNEVHMRREAVALEHMRQLLGLQADCPPGSGATSDLGFFYMKQKISTVHFGATVVTQASMHPAIGVSQPQVERLGR